MKTRLALFVLIATVLFVNLPALTRATQESKERIIKRMVQQNEPLAITEMKVNGRNISFDQRFLAEDDWMRGLVLSVKNTSDKRILLATIRLMFPPPSGKNQRSVFYLHHGNSFLRSRPPRPDEQLVGIAPGESEQISFSAQKFADLQHFLSDVGYRQAIEKVDLTIDSVIFEDDIMWSGDEFRRDPENPSSWINTRPGDSQPN